MGAIEGLQIEHRVIERAIDALAGFSHEVRLGGCAQEDLRQFVHFLGGFADDVHHSKEEDLLFPAMVAAGLPRNSGPLALMMHEHAVGRSYLWMLQVFAEKEHAWSRNDREEIAERAASYAALLRAHIQKEDGVLFPLARRRLTAGTMARLDAACANLDLHKRAGHFELVTLALALANRYAPVLQHAASRRGLDRRLQIVR